MPHKFAWPMPDLRRPSLTWQLGSSFTVPAVGILSKILLGCFNKATIHNREVLINVLDKRASGKALLTVSNHDSCLDDPALWGMLDWRHLCQAKVMRWSTAAEDVCFTQKSHCGFFAFGKTVPIVRGDGVYQRAMDYCIELLGGGHWLHFFPEGKVNMTCGSDLIRLKWGVGRLISEAKDVPIVLPFWHVGMNGILPNTKPYIPRIGKKVTVLIGKPLDLTKVVEKMKQERKSALEKRKIITDLIQEEMKHLKEQAETLHLNIS